MDLDNRRIILREHKTDANGAKSVPLNSEAVSVLKNLPRQRGNPYVIVGRDGDGHLVNLQKPWDRVRRRARLTDVRIHDLRHSFASAAINSGVSLPIVGGLLGHKSMQATQRYAHLAHDPVAAASELAAGHFRLRSKAG